jgi:transcriptional regulator with XRE-family HTH domain
LTPEQLKEIMRKLDFSTADVAVVMGVTRRTVQLWLAGKSPIPTSVDILLYAIFEGLLTIEWVEERLILSLQIA